MGAILIFTEPLFSPEEQAHGVIYRVFNSLHIPTGKPLIRRFLLFKEGDPYDPIKVAETERNLRALGVFKSVKITPGPPHEGVVEVTVETQDEWSAEPNIDFSHGGDADVYEIDITQRNLFGRGGQVTLGAEKTTERSSRFVDVGTPDLFVPYWNGRLRLVSSSDGGEGRLAIERPLFSLSNRWTFAFEADYLRLHKRLYDLGEPVALFGQRHQDVRAEVGRSIGASERHARRLLLGVDLVDDRFASLKGEPLPPDVPTPTAEAAPLPERRHFRYLYVGYESLINDLVQLDYVNWAQQVEDFDLGRKVGIRLGVSPVTAEPGGKAGLVRLNAQEGWRLAGRGFLLSRLSFETRREGGGMANQIGSGSVLVVYRLSEAGHQTLVGRAELVRGSRLDQDVQFLADTLHGLRAYPIHAYAGNKRVLFNLEDRFYLGRELWQAFSPGFALFFDSGVAEQPGHPLGLGDLKSDVGVGLRVAIPRAKDFILRFDCALQLNRDPQGHRGVVLSIATNQAF